MANPMKRTMPILSIALLFLLQSCGRTTYYLDPHYDWTDYGCLKIRLWCQARTLDEREDAESNFDLILGITRGSQGCIGDIELASVELFRVEPISGDTLSVRLDDSRTATLEETRSVSHTGEFILRAPLPEFLVLRVTYHFSNMPGLPQGPKVEVYRLERQEVRGYSGK